jgi:hypothetical protein
MCFPSRTLSNYARVIMYYVKQLRLLYRLDRANEKKKKKNLQSELRSYMYTQARVLIFIHCKLSTALHAINRYLDQMCTIYIYKHKYFIYYHTTI